MIKVLIADDEPEFRQYLADLTDWDALGFQICGQARNGMEALEMAASHAPDIALLDINMPVLDGLAVAEQLKSANEHMRIALVTGYGEFEYARKAIKLGVEDYVLKPFNKDELLGAMLKFKAMINKLREEAAQAKDELHFTRERWLNALLTEEFDAQEPDFVRFFEQRGIQAGSGPFVVATVEIDNMYQLWGKSKDIALWKFAVANVLTEIVGAGGPLLVFNGPEGRIVAIHCGQGPEVEVEEEAADGAEQEDYRKVCDYVKKYFRFTVTVGLSRTVARLPDIRGAYSETVIALQNKLSFGSGGIIRYEALNESGRGTGFNSMKWNEELLSALRRNDAAEAEAALARIAAHIGTNKLPFDFAYAILMSVVSLGLSHITEMGGDVEQVLGANFRPYQQLRKMTSLEESFVWLGQIFGKTIDYHRSQRVSRPLQIARDVKEHIEGRYADGDLSVENIARHFHLDASYIRRVFVKEFGLNVAEYLTQVRMNQAKLLLETTEMKLQEVSERVGYGDAGYFSKAFKKHFGMLPSECKGRP